jgi:hypothetical protein
VSGAECRQPQWPQAFADVFHASLPHLASLCMLHGLVQAMNWRSRQLGHRASRQEELVLIILIAMSLTNLMARLSLPNKEDYIFASFLMICGPSLLKVRWWLAMISMAVPMVTALVCSSMTYCYSKCIHDLPWCCPWPQLCSQALQIADSSSKNVCCQHQQAGASLFDIPPSLLLARAHVLGSLTRKPAFLI